jgi:hypothetical protein
MRRGNGELRAGVQLELRAKKVYNAPARAVLKPTSLAHVGTYLGPISRSHMHVRLSIRYHLRTNILNPNYPCPLVTCVIVACDGAATDISAGAQFQGHFDAIC